MLSAVLALTLTAGQVSGVDADGTPPRAVVLSVPFSTHNRIPDDAGTVAHVVFDGAKLVDTKGNAWVQNGTVPQTAQSPFYPNGFVAPPAGGAGPFSDTNYYTLGAGADVLDFTGDFSACFVYFLRSTPPGGGWNIFANGAWQVGGWYLTVGPAATTLVTNSAGAGAVTNSPNAPTVGGLNVVCTGRAGATQYVKANAGSIASNAGALTAPGTGNLAYLGAPPGFDAVIYEAWFSTTPPSDALFTRIQRHVFGMEGSRGEPVTVTRATTATYLDPTGALQTAPPGVLRLVSAGSRTNYLPWSERFTSWDGQDGNGVHVTTSAVAPPTGIGAAYLLTKLSGNAWDGAYKVIEQHAAGDYTFSVYLRATPSSDTATIGFYDWSAGNFAGPLAAAVTGPGTVVTDSLVATVTVSGLSQTEWSRVSLRANFPGAAGNDRVYVYPGGSYSTTAGAAILATGAQVEQGGLSDYIRTGATWVTVAQPLGALIEPAATNYLQGSAVTGGGTAAATAWAVQSGATLASAVPGFLDGGNWAVLSNTSSWVGMAQTPSGLPSGTTVTASTWMRKASGTGPASLFVNCLTPAASTCTCTRSDGGACTGVISGTVCTAQVTDLGVAPVRLSATATCASAVTSAEVRLIPGTYNVATGTTYFAGAQVETGPVATSYIPTNSTAVTRNADAVSVANPLKASNTRWCAAATVTPLGPWTPSGAQNIIGSSAATGWVLTRGITNTQFTVNDGGGRYRQAYSAVALGSGPHSVVGCSRGTTSPALYIDGASVGSLAGNGGTGVTVQPATLYIGSTSAGGTMAGAVKGVLLTRSDIVSKTATAPPEPLLSLPFATPGCYPSGSALGTKGERVTVARASTATYVDANGIVQTCPAGSLRVTPQGALIEPARTNILARSQEMDNAAWAADTAHMTITPNATVAPDGTMTAEHVVATGASHYLFGSVAVTPSTTYTFSFWAKDNGSAAAATAVLDVTNSAWLTPLDYKSQLVVGEWRRITQTINVPAGCTALYVDLLRDAGDADLYLWGAQVEAGAYATSYIPTAATSMTRNADQVSVATPGGLSAGAWAVAGTYQPAAWTAYSSRLFALGTYAAANTVDVLTGNGGGGAFYVPLTIYDAAAASKFNNTANKTYANGSSHRLSFALPAAAWADGAPWTVTGTSGTGTGILSALPSTIYLGAISTGGFALGGTISDFRVCDVSATPAPGACR